MTLDRGSPVYRRLVLTALDWAMLAAPFLGLLYSFLIMTEAARPYGSGPAN